VKGNWVGEFVVVTRATERKLAAIMVADITGFSRLMEREESLTFARLRQLREEVTHCKVNSTVVASSRRLVTAS
jgi:class 3 adenylate cyclase